MDEYNDRQRLLTRYGFAKGNWENWRSLYDEAYAYTLPNRNPWPLSVSEGRRKNIHVYDITAVNSVRRLVSRLHNTLFPLGQQWFSLEAGERITDASEKKQVNAYLQVFTDIIFEVLNESNFDLVINEVLQDLCIGTGAMMILESKEKNRPVKFKAVPMDQLYPEADNYDEIESVWRDFNGMYGRDINRYWPMAKLTPTMLEKMKQDPMCKFDFIEGVLFEPETSSYRVIVLCRNNTDCILDVMTPSSPWVVARWSKASNEVGGRGAVIEALPTIRSVNVLSEEIMRNVALSTSPPWMAASDGVFNPYLFQIEPNKIIPISRQSMGDFPLKRLDVASDFNMGTLELNDLRQQVKDALFDFPLRPVNAPPATATEIMIRQQQFMEETSPALGRLSVELQPKIINRVIFILQRKGYLPKELKIDNKNITIRYTSPITQSAEFQKVQNLQNYMGVMQSMVGAEMALGSINIELLPQWLSDKLDVDESLVKSPGEIGAGLQRAQDALNPPAQEEEPQNTQQPAVNQIQAQQAGLVPNG